MAETTSPELLSSLDVAIDPDFEPQKRPRSCTWPLPESSLAKPEANDTYIIPEEEDDEEESAMVINVNGDDGRPDGLISSGDQDQDQDQAGSQTQVETKARAAEVNGQAVQQQQQQQQTPRKSSSRRNAWGNLSYADLITKAIESTQDKRLTLSQIYDWMVRNVPYFKDKGDSNSSAGWKVRRHCYRMHFIPVVSSMFMLRYSCRAHPDCHNQNKNKNKRNTCSGVRERLKAGGRARALKHSDRSARVTQFRGDAHDVICKQNI